MSFQNAIGTDARGATFTDIGGDQYIRNQTITVVQHESGQEALFRGLLVPDAAYDCPGTRTGCLEGTREVVIEKILEWVGGDSDRRICWFNAPAGFGKSAIAQTIAVRCADDGTLVASFFFKRGAGGRSRITGFIPTLAYQLARSVPGTKQSIQSVLLDDGPTILHQSLENQFKKLIVNPIIALGKPLPPMVVVIDALDECDDKDNMAKFIEILVHASRDRRLPVRFFVTGRAENHIQQKFSPPEADFATYCLKLDDFDALADIRTFLLSRFSAIYNERPRLFKGVNPPWPTSSDLEALVEKSSGAFVFASTLVEFLTDERGTPQRKLEAVLKTHAGLDPLYTQVFFAVPRDEYFDRVIGTIMLLREQLPIIELACLLELAAGDILQAVLGIQSILRIPEDDDQPIQLIHASLRDFLMEKQRSEIYFINPPIRHIYIAMDCLKIMTKDAKGNNFATSRASSYACYNWIHHLDGALANGNWADFSESSLTASLIICLQGFKSHVFNYWINMDIHKWGTGYDDLDLLSALILRLMKWHKCPKDVLFVLKNIMKHAKSDKNDLLWDVHDLVNWVKPGC